MNDERALRLLRVSAHVAQESADAVHIVERIREEPDLDRARVKRAPLPGDLAQKPFLTVLMEHGKIVRKQHELLRENARDRVKQSREAGDVDRLSNRGRDPTRDVPIDRLHEPKHLIVLSQRRQPAQERQPQFRMLGEPSFD